MSKLSNYPKMVYRFRDPADCYRVECRVRDRHIYGCRHYYDYSVRAHGYVTDVVQRYLKDLACPWGVGSGIGPGY